MTRKSFSIKMTIIAAMLALLPSCASPSGHDAICAFGDVQERRHGEPKVTDSFAIGHLLEDDVLMGPEDFAVMPADGEGRWRLFVSLTDRTDKESKGQIRTVIFDERGGPENRGAFEKATVRNLVPRDFEGVFHPIGLSLVKNAKGYDLYVINARDKAHGGLSSDLNRIERFHVEDGGQSLRYKGSRLEDKAIVGPNDVLATEDGDIYVSNPWFPLMYRLGDYFSWPSLVHIRGGALSDFDPDTANFDVVDKRMRFSNGIALPESDQLLVADFAKKAIKVFQRNPADGSIEEEDEIEVRDEVHRQSISGSPDNLMTSGDGTKVYIAAHKSRWDTALHLFLGKERAPSAIFELDAPVSDDSKTKLILDDDGRHLQAASTAMMLGKHLIVSQLKQPELVAFTCKDQGESLPR